jgi:ribose/xylose/arabinose/galactoside ABC-type transport system permease subunit
LYNFVEPGTPGSGGYNTYFFGRDLLWFFEWILSFVIGLPPFVAASGVKFIADGLTLFPMGGNILFGFPKPFVFLGTGFICKKIPVLAIISAALIIVFYVILSNPC